MKHDTVHTIWLLGRENKPLVTDGSGAAQRNTGRRLVTHTSDTVAETAYGPQEERRGIKLKTLKLFL